MKAVDLDAVQIISISLSGGEISRFTPLQRAIKLRVPTRPQAVESRVLPVALQGFVGLAVNGMYTICTLCYSACCE